MVLVTVKKFHWNDQFVLNSCSHSVGMIKNRLIIRSNIPFFGFCPTSQSIPFYLRLYERPNKIVGTFNSQNCLSFNDITTSFHIWVSRIVFKLILGQIKNAHELLGTYKPRPISKITAKYHISADNAAQKHLQKNQNHTCDGGENSNEQTYYNNPLFFIWFIANKVQQLLVP